MFESPPLPLQEPKTPPEVLAQQDRVSHVEALLTSHPLFAREDRKEVECPCSPSAGPWLTTFPSSSEHTSSSRIRSPLVASDRRRLK